MQFVFAHPDRGVRADRHEAKVCGNIFGGDSVDVSDTHDLGIAAHKVEGAAIHIDRPYRGVWRLKSESEGDRSPSTAQIKQVSTGWRRGSVVEQDLGARINALGRKDAIGRNQFSGLAGQSNVNLAEFEFTLG